MITLSPYNPSWPMLFEEEKQRLNEILSPLDLQIEHIGSTAIPGVYAKPVIDIMIGINSLNQFTEDDIKKIESLGYKYNPVFESVFPHRRYFQKNDASSCRTHQIHLINYPSAWWEQHVMFRDYLRHYPMVAKEYEQHKLALAKQHDDTISYANAKTAFCREVNKKAYFDFAINKPFAETKRLYGYMPQESCFDIYAKMFQDSDFVGCFGIRLSDDEIQEILHRDAGYWDQYGFGPLVWFDKVSHEFVGEGGLNHALVDGVKEIELTYSLSKKYWGKGVAVEIGEYAIELAFKKLHLNHIVCFTMTTNHQSLRVMEKLQFNYERDFMRDNLPHKLYKIENENIS